MWGVSHNVISSRRRSSVHSPDVQLLRKQEVAVEVRDGAVHGVAVTHLHHGGTRFALHELDL